MDDDVREGKANSCLQFSFFTLEYKMRETKKCIKYMCLRRVTKNEESRAENKTILSKKLTLKKF